MPRQHELPHTAAPKGPCDAARDAWLDAKQAAADAAWAKKRTLTDLLDKMLDTNTSRVPFVDPKTGKRKWLEITESERKLRTVKAEKQEGLDRQSPADRMVDPTGADGWNQSTATDDANVADMRQEHEESTDETSAQAAARESSEARASRRKRGSR